MNILFPYLGVPHPDTSFPASMQTYSEHNLCGHRQSTKEVLLSLQIDEVSNQLFL